MLSLLKYNETRHTLVYICIYMFFTMFGVVNIWIIFYMGKGHNLTCKLTCIDHLYIDTKAQTTKKVLSSKGLNKGKNFT